MSDWHRSSARAEEAQEIVVVFLLTNVSPCSIGLLLGKQLLNLSVSCLGRRVGRAGTLVS